MHILAGDIGGTKTLLQLAEADSSTRRVIDEHRYDSRSFENFTELAENFLQKHAGLKPDAACFAVAGPVRNHKANVTYLPWVLDEQQLQQQLEIKHITLVNDFQAVAHGIATLEEKDLFVLQQGLPEPRGTCAVLGAGTGLGECIIPWQQDHYKPLPTEGGHVDFAPRNDLQIELLKYLVAKLGRASYDTILSGKGLVHIYQFLIATNRGESSQAIENEMKGNDEAAVISYYGINEIDDTAEQALNLFISIYGAQAGNLALTTLATGGVYIAGGIAPKIIERLNSDTFMNAFLDKAPMKSVLEQIPVKVIMNEKVGLLGAVEIAIKTVASG